jgi:hypothetical protein
LSAFSIFSMTAAPSIHYFDLILRHLSEFCLIIIPLFHHIYRRYDVIMASQGEPWAQLICSTNNDTDPIYISKEIFVIGRAKGRLSHGPWHAGHG